MIEKIELIPEDEQLEGVVVVKKLNEMIDEINRLAKEPVAHKHINLGYQEEK